MHIYSVGMFAAEGWWNSLTNEGQAFYRGKYFLEHGMYAAEDVVAYWAVNNLKDIDMNKLVKPVFADMESPLKKPTGKQVTYFFTSGERFEIFGVTKHDLSGSWHRITDHEGSEHVIDPAKVNHIKSKTV